MCLDQLSLAIKDDVGIVPVVAQVGQLVEEVGAVKAHLGALKHGNEQSTP